MKPTSGWSQITVGEAGRIDLGRQRHPDWHTGPQMRPYLRVANVFEDRIDTSDLKEMDFSGCFDRYRLVAGDVLLNEGQSPELLGRPAIYRGVPENVAFTNTLIRFRPYRDVTPEWALLVFRHYMHSGRFAREARITTNIAHLSAARLKTVEFPVPPLVEQRRIVAILEEHLSSLDQAAASLKRVEAQARTLLAMSASEIRLGEETPLPELAVIQGGIQKQSKRAPRDHAFPFLRVANVTAHGLDLRDIHRIELFEGELERYTLLRGDLLVVEGNGSPSQIGRAALWDGSLANCVHQNHLIRVRPNQEKVIPEYLEAIWNSPENRAVLTEVASSSSGLHTLSVRKLAQLRMPVPTLQVQRRLVAQLGLLREADRRLRNTTTMARVRGGVLRRAILSAAFSGRLTGRSSDSAAIEEVAEEQSA